MVAAMTPITRCVVCLIVLVVAACADAATETPLDNAARDYVRMALGIGTHEKDYVDAYYGPPEWTNRGRSPAAHDRGADGGSRAHPRGARCDRSRVAPTARTPASRLAHRPRCERRDAPRHDRRCAPSVSRGGRAPLRAAPAICVRSKATIRCSLASKRSCPVTVRSANASKRSAIATWCQRIASTP